MWSRKHCGHLGHQIPLELVCGTEETGAAHVDEQHHRQLTLFFEYLDVRGVVAGCHIPVHIAHIVAVLILANLAEGHTASLEGAMVLARKYLVGQGFRLDLYLPDLLE